MIVVCKVTFSEGKWEGSKSEEGASSGSGRCDGNRVGNSEWFLIGCSEDIIVTSVGIGSCAGSDEAPRKLQKTILHMFI